MMTAAEKLRFNRQKMGLTQMQLGMKADIGHSTIAKIERNERFNVKYSTMMKLSKALGVSPVYLFYDHDVKALDMTFDRPIYAAQKLVNAIYDCGYRNLNEFARLTGVDRLTIDRFIHDNTDFTHHQIARIAKYLDKSIKYIFFQEEDEPVEFKVKADYEYVRYVKFLPKKVNQMEYINLDSRIDNLKAEIKTTQQKLEYKFDTLPPEIRRNEKLASYLNELDNYIKNGLRLKELETADKLINGGNKNDDERQGNGGKQG